MIELAKRLVLGSRWEGPIRRAHFVLTRRKNSLYDYQTLAVMKRVLKADSNAIDAGAFEGGMLRHIVRMAPRGTHLAFEPQPERFERLKRTFPSVRVHPCALGARSGEASFHVVERHPALSGLRPRSDLTIGDPVREIRVPTCTLDEVVPPDLPVAFMKVDVEGGECDLFRGGVVMLRRTKPVVVFEYGIGAADSYGVRPFDLYDLLQSTIGLKVQLLGDWLSGGKDLSRDEFARHYEERIDYYFIAHP